MSFDEAIAQVWLLLAQKLSPPEAEEHFVQTAESARPGALGIDEAV